MREMRETSILAYQSIEPTLGKRQQLVYDCIVKCNKQDYFPTDLEITKQLGFSDPNKVRPRRKELYDLDLIEIAGRRVCLYSNRLALTWKIKK